MSEKQPHHAIRILVVDDHVLFRAGLRLIIEANPKLKIIGEVGTLSEAITVANNTQPDIILLDMLVGKENGLDVIPKLLNVSRKSRILVLTSVTDPEIHHHAFQLGALGLMKKDQTPELLIEAIEKMYAGEAWIDRLMIAQVLNSLSHPTKTKNMAEAEKLNTITKREHEIIALVARGLKNKQIAEQLSISEITVRHHLTTIFSKLDVTDRFELIIYAFKHGICEIPTLKKK